MSLLLEPFTYQYMVNAMWVSALVGGVCAFLSAYLMLKGWSLIGDALSHSIVPGVAGAYMLGLPFSLGAFLAGGLAAGAMLFLNQRTRLKEDAIIGLIFTSFFGRSPLSVGISSTFFTVARLSASAVFPNAVYCRSRCGARSPTPSTGTRSGAPTSATARPSPAPSPRAAPSTTTA